MEEYYKAYSGLGRHPRHRHLHERPANSEERPGTLEQVPGVPVVPNGSKGFVRLGSMVLVLALTVSVSANDWPHWRGPAATGVAAPSPLPSTWSATENVAWQAPLAGRRRVVADRVRQSRVRDVAGRRRPPPRRQSSDADAGRRSGDGGRVDAVAPRPAPTSPSSSKPSIGRRASGCGFTRRRRRASCRRCTTSTTWRAPVRSPTASASTRGSAPARSSRSTSNGKPVWSKHLGKEYGAFDINWGHASSPVLFEDSIILLCYHSPASYISRSTSAPAR